MLVLLLNSKVFEVKLLGDVAAVDTGIREVVFVSDFGLCSRLHSNFAGSQRRATARNLLGGRLHLGLLGQQLLVQRLQLRNLLLEGGALGVLLRGDKQLELFFQFGDLLLHLGGRGNGLQLHLQCFQLQIERIALSVLLGLKGCVDLSLFDFDQLQEIRTG